MADLSLDGPKIDRAAAERVHYVDPRVRLLASTRWRLATGWSHRSWLGLGKNNPDALIQEARDWLRAAVAAGLLPPPGRADIVTVPAADLRHAVEVFTEAADTCTNPDCASPICRALARLKAALNGDNLRG
ncbi:hypothetical protein [Sphaerimonospora thailandensis]|uniref:Uncharacterized protein n=1 Tax=Sphaerimonospora thailandensis TaxID=795644 RepID=A0A8J3VYQ6_9ACTN|nr:hypothetical protein [Sphaerimonospora thailandensis]GIH70309.1 hypothetical protein Mth01_25620 [Sphaerimonospora thailandensis]